MTSPVIRVEGLGKRYRIGAKQKRPQGFRRNLQRMLSVPFDYLRASLREPTAEETLWALREISFEVAQGEVVGVIGRNGAGKSTLLKILTRITEPTEGQARLTGRVGSLLEVGTGFHPEFTGRENVYLNGAILGMSKSEIDRKFDEIVDFSGVERFIDTQVKRYSSGMRVRLAFSVAAHLEPEILLIDEVLAVGDAGFQRKCLGKMEEIGQQGRTVLFVSHNMPTISRLCDRTILLDGGLLVEDGPSSSVVGRYLQSDLGTSAHRAWKDRTVAPSCSFASMQSIRVIDKKGEVTETHDIRREIGIEATFQVDRYEVPFIPEIILHNGEGLLVFISMDTAPRWRSTPDPGVYTCTAWIPGNLLAEGTHIATFQLISLSSGATIQHLIVPDAVAFHTIDLGEGDTAKGDFRGTWNMAVSPLLSWTCEAPLQGSSV